MFSNGTEGDMFTGAWCAHCRFAYRGDEQISETAPQLCDEASPILWDGPPPGFLRRVKPTPRDPTGVVCDRFAEKP